MALKLLAGRHASRTYPTRAELLDFGRRICGVSQPMAVLRAIAQGMSETLKTARADDRLPAGLLDRKCAEWEEGMLLAR